MRLQHFQLVEQNYNKLKRALERVLQLTSIVLDETLFETKYGPLPPRIEKSKSGCMLGFLFSFKFVVKKFPFSSN